MPAEGIDANACVSLAAIIVCLFAVWWQGFMLGRYPGDRRPILLAILCAAGAMSNVVALVRRSAEHLP